MKKPCIDESLLSLDEWLNVIKPHPDDREFLVADYQFPTDDLRDEYLAGVSKRKECEVKMLLRRFLITSGSYGSDLLTHKSLGQLDADKLLNLIEEKEFVKKLMMGIPPWEGVTWVLDLLPDSPDEAIKVINAYMFAHIQFLPEGRIFGLSDVISIIRARYFQYEHLVDHILAISTRDFEYLIAALYSKQGFNSAVTKASRDGGVDVIAINTESGAKETVFIECKLYTNPVGVKIIREFSGVVESSKANRGIVVTSSRFTKDAIEFASENRIELVGWTELNQLFNQYLGQNWINSIDKFIVSQKLDQKSQ